MKRQIILLLGMLLILIVLVTYLQPILLDQDVQAHTIIHVPSSDFPNITSAISVAQHGDTIMVVAGTYHENLALKNGVILQGAGSSETIIDGGSNGSVIQATDIDATAKIDGFSIINGTGTGTKDYTYGGGLYLWNSSLTISNCIVKGNKADYGGGICALKGSMPNVIGCIFKGNTGRFQGGGMYNSESFPTIEKCDFLANQSLIKDERGGGGGISNNNGSDAAIIDCKFIDNLSYNDGGGVHNIDSNPKIRGCLFSRNAAPRDSGGGIRNTRAAATITDCIFRDSNVAPWGGAISNKWSNATIKGCIFENNIATIEGGAIHEHDAAARITDCVFKNNVAPKGGAILNFTETVADRTTIIDCEFYNNKAEQGGGAMSNYTTDAFITGSLFKGNTANWGGAIELRKSALVVQGCKFEENVAKSAGGGIVDGTNSTLNLDRCTFSYNVANVGGGITVGSSEAIMMNSLVLGNKAKDVGGGIYSDNGTLNIVNCLITANEAVKKGGGAYSSKSFISIANSILWGDMPNELSGSDETWDVNYSDVLVATDVFPNDVYPGNLNMNIDPLLSSNFTLRPLSPCIDKGSNAVVFTSQSDLVNNPRIVDGDGDGYPVIDIGPLEYNSGSVVKADKDDNIPATSTDVIVNPDNGNTLEQNKSISFAMIFLVISGCVLTAAIVFLVAINQIHIKRDKT